LIIDRRAGSEWERGGSLKEENDKKRHFQFSVID